MTPAEPIHTKAWAIVRAFGAERATMAETRATIEILGRMGAFARSERELLHAAGLFPEDEESRS